jgi:exodeoxyribonuclease VII small subunit
MTDATPDLVAADGSPLPYGDALDELEAILAELDASTVDVDQLADQVKRASALVRYCRARLDVVRADMAEVVDDLRGDGAGDA